MATLRMIYSPVVGDAVGVNVSPAFVGVCVVGDEVGAPVVGDAVVGEDVLGVTVGASVVGDGVVGASVVGDPVVGEPVAGVTVFDLLSCHAPNLVIFGVLRSTPIVKVQIVSTTSMHALVYDRV